MIKKPIVTPTSITAKMVHFRTGFRDSFMLLSYVLIVCNGDLELMRKRSSSLTWYKEWFLFFEVVYGNTISSFVYAAKLYQIKTRYMVQHIFDQKLNNYSEL